MSRTDTVETLLPESPQADTSFQHLTREAQVSEPSADSLTRDTWVSEPSADSLTRDTWVSEPSADSLTRDTWVSEPSADSLTRDTWVSEPSADSLTRDTWVSEPSADSLTRDTWVSEPSADSLTRDTWVSEPSADSLTRDTWVSEPSADSLTRDTWVSEPSADRLAQDTWVSEPSADSERMTPGDSSPAQSSTTLPCRSESQQGNTGSDAESFEYQDSSSRGQKKCRGEDRRAARKHRGPARMASKVSELIYWKDAQRTGVVFTGLVVSLIALSQLSIISVGSNLAFAVLCVTITLRLYYKTLQALHKSDGANPFQWYLDYDISVSKELTQRCMDRVVLMATTAATELRRLFLVDNFLDSFKPHCLPCGQDLRESHAIIALVNWSIFYHSSFALLMYLLTYIGAVFNGLTLLIMAVICAFSLPLLYRQHQTQIDQYVGLVTGLITDITNKRKFQVPNPKNSEEKGDTRGASPSRTRRLSCLRAPLLPGVRGYGKGFERQDLKAEVDGRVGLQFAKTIGVHL
ncbi:RTN2 protein, partial [Atractosteus spatula]|nr:RTN2 protein [Atractosteus spatula]